MSVGQPRPIPPTLEPGGPGGPEVPLPEVGTVLGEYQLTEVLGQGSMGRVYRARHSILGQEYALKVMAAHHAAVSVREERFRREAQATARLDHPNVVRVVYSGLTERGQIYLVMELLRGRSLSEVIAERPLAPARAGRILQQVASGLGAIHDLGLLHRDIKPSNVILEGQGDQERAKILDLGLVGFVDPEPDVRITQHGHLMGTPIYMAPEALSQAQHSVQSDLYSLGAMFYEMLSGQPPFDGTLKEVLWHHHVTAPPSLPSAHGLEEVVYQLLEKQPERRPKSAQAVVEEIDRRLAKTSNALRLEDAPKKLRRRITRRLGPRPDGPDWVARGAVFLASLLVTFAFYWALNGDDGPTIEALLPPEPPVATAAAHPDPTPVPGSPAPVSPGPVSPAPASAAPAVASSPPGPEPTPVPGPATLAVAEPPVARSTPPRRTRERSSAKVAKGPVEVTITSDPPGAVVETGTGRLGLTPLAVVIPTDRRTPLRIWKEGFVERRLTYGGQDGRTRVHVRLTPRGDR